MNTKTDEGLYEKARKLFISKASIDEFAGWATPRQVDAVHRLLDTELANRERAKHDRLLRRARFPVVKGLDGYDFTNVRLCFVKLGSAFCAVFFRSVGSGFSAGCAVSAAACLRCVGYLVMRACSLR